MDKAHGPLESNLYVCSIDRHTIWESYYIMYFIYIYITVAPQGSKWDQGLMH